MIFANKMRDFKRNGSSGQRVKWYVKKEVRSILDSTIGAEDHRKHLWASLKHGIKRFDEECVQNGFPFFWELMTITTDEFNRKLLVDILVRHRVDLNQVNDHGMNVFHYCMYFGMQIFRQRGLSVTEMQPLLKWFKGLGVDPHLKDKDGDDIFKYALYANAPAPFLSFLIDDICGQEVISRKNYFGATPLHLAAKYCSIEVFDFLVEKNADLFARDNLGNNFLHHLFLKGFQDNNNCSYELTAVQAELIKKFAPFLKDQMNHRNMTPLAVLLEKEAGFIDEEENEESDIIFDCLIPSLEIINIKYIPRETGEPTSLLRKVVFHGEGLRRIRKLVDAGAIVTPEVIQEGIKSRIETLETLFELKAVSHVDNLKGCFGQHCDFSIMTEVLKHIPDGRKLVKEQFPDILVQSLRCMKKSENFDLSVVKTLVEEYDVDAIYTSREEGTSVHWLASFINDEDERIDVLKQLLEKYGNAFNNLLSLKTKLKSYSGRLLTPLQIAIDSGSYRFAMVLLQNFAPTNDLSLPDKVYHDYESHAPFYRLLLALKFVGVTDPKLDTLLSNIRSKYLWNELREQGIPSLLELSCQVLRRNSTRDQIHSLIKGIKGVSKAKTFLALNHIQELVFPESPDYYSYDNYSYGYSCWSDDEYAIESYYLPFVDDPDWRRKEKKSKKRTRRKKKEKRKKDIDSFFLVRVELEDRPLN